MKKILMFGSSHAACFRTLESSEYKLSICAGKKGRLFRNLLLSSNGYISPSDLIDDYWKDTDVKLFKDSLGESSRNINNYDYFIINIQFYLDLPVLIHGDKRISRKIILNIANSLIKKIIKQNDLLVRDAQETINFISRIKKAGIDHNKIFVFPIPFSTLDHDYNKIKENDERLNHRISEILKFVPQIFFNQIPNLVLPDIDMFENGLFIKKEYGKGQNKWEERKKTFKQFDRYHKNEKYAKRMMDKVINLIDSQNLSK